MASEPDQNSDENAENQGLSQVEASPLQWRPLALRAAVRLPTNRVGRYCARDRHLPVKFGRRRANRLHLLMIIGLRAEKLKRLSGLVTFTKEPFSSAQTECHE